MGCGAQFHYYRTFTKNRSFFYFSMSMWLQALKHIVCGGSSVPCGWSIYSTIQSHLSKTLESCRTWRANWGLKAHIDIDPFIFNNDIWAEPLLMTVISFDVQPHSTDASLSGLFDKLCSTGWMTNECRVIHSLSRPYVLYVNCLMDVRIVLFDFTSRLFSPHAYNVNAFFSTNAIDDELHDYRVFNDGVFFAAFRQVSCHTSHISFSCIVFDMRFSATQLSEWLMKYSIAPYTRSEVISFE